LVPELVLFKNVSQRLCPEGCLNAATASEISGFSPYLHIFKPFNPVLVSDYFSHFNARPIGQLSRASKNLVSIIAALDPAGGRFQRRNKVNRLDEGDAKSVHAVHTDTRRYGEGEIIGSADICVNNGRQPFCKDATSRLKILSWNNSF
jgi:Lipase